MQKGNSTDMKTLPITDLEEHPWQKNVPNITGKPWGEFLRDIKERGVQDPITVSMRTGKPVIVDGHQRGRAAREVGYTHLQAIVKPFANELEEIVFLANSARYRRHLTDAQRIALGEALELELKPKADEARREGNAKGGKGSKSFANWQTTSEPVHTHKQVAEAVGMSPRQYSRGKKVKREAPEPVREAWEQGQLSTHAAHRYTVPARDPITQAVHTGELSVPEATTLERNKTLRMAVKQGTRQPKEAAQEAMSLADQMKAQRLAEEREMGTEVANRVSDALQSILDITPEVYLEAVNTRTNRELWGEGINDMLEDAIDVLNAAKTLIDSESRTIEVLN